jgi:excinuclease ABC subunit B
LERFQLVSEFQPSHACLLGVTGSGKTFTVATHRPAQPPDAGHLPQQDARRPALRRVSRALSPQRRRVLRQLLRLLPARSVHPPARHLHRKGRLAQRRSRSPAAAATSSLVSRRDVIIVASVSCIFGLGSPDAYKASMIPLAGETRSTRQAAAAVRPTCSTSATTSPSSAGVSRARRRGRTAPGVRAVRLPHRDVRRRDRTLDFINPTSGEVLATEDKLFIFPAVHYVMPEDRIASAVASIQEELEQR